MLLRGGGQKSAEEGMDRFCPEEVSHVSVSEEESNKGNGGKSVSFKILGYFQEGINEMLSSSS